MARVMLSIMLMVFITGVASAQQDPLKIMMTDALTDLAEKREVERDDNGNLMTQPGDVIRYTLMAENSSNGSLHNIKLVDPIPAGTEFVLGSATGNGTEINYSIDGGSTYVQQPTIQVQDGNGQMVTRPAPASMYTNVQWTLTQPLQPKEKRSVELRVRVQ